MKKLVHSLIFTTMLAGNLVAQTQSADKESESCCYRARYWAVKMNKAESEQALEQAYKKYAQSKAVCDAKKAAYDDRKLKKELMWAGAGVTAFTVIMGMIIYVSK